jgi:nucleoside-diphosphate-sugar epimerase
MHKKILITGSSGFIGQELVRKLKNNKQITLYLLINKKKIIIKYKNIKFIYCSLLSSEKLKKIFNKLNITDVIHCAWVGVNAVSRDSLKQKKNIKITNNLLNAIKDKKLNCFITLGSQAEYGSKFKRIYEESKARPVTKYGKIKIKILNKIKIFCIKNNVRFVWLRIFTGYGPGNDKNWIIPSTIYKLIKNKKTKFTNGQQIYNFIYVADIASAIIKSLFNNKANGVFNLASEKSYSIKYIIKLIFKKLRIKKKPVFGELSYRNDQVMKFLPSITKIKKKLKWKPVYSISTGIDKMIKFIEKKNINQ